MSIVSNYIWEKGTDGGRNPVSLVAQQVKLQVGLQGREICLFCVCESSEEELGGRMTERLVEWFHKSCLPACEGRKPPVLQELLERELHGIRRELLEREAHGIRREMPGREAHGIRREMPGREDSHCGRIDYGGLLLTGSSFYLFGEGDVRVQLANCRYNRPQLKELDFPLYGRIQKGVGLLLHTPQLTRNLKPEEVCQILHGQGQWQEERIGRRLRELYQESRSRGSAGPVGGIYLQVV